MRVLVDNTFLGPLFQSPLELGADLVARVARAALGLDPKTTKRIVFHEITKEAIGRAVAAPRDLDMNLVEAQEIGRAHV